MPRYIDTTSYEILSVAICSRCSMKRPYSFLIANPANPSMRVCPKCADQPDPYLTPFPTVENVSLRHPRPDEPIAQE